MREITIDGKHYEWSMGKSDVLIKEIVPRGTKGDRYFPFLNDVFEGDAKRAAWKGYLNITPADIAEWIKKQHEKEKTI